MEPVLDLAVAPVVDPIAARVEPVTRIEDMRPPEPPRFAKRTREIDAARCDFVKKKESE
jgi:hypothetical protein